MVSEESTVPVKKTTLCALVILFLCVLAPAGEPEDDEAKYRSAMEEGRELIKVGGHDELTRAINRFKAALRIKPESAEAYYWIALAYSDQNNSRRAADNAKEATIYDEQMPQAWLLWGQILLYDREWNNAREKLEKAAQLSPDDPQVLFNLGRVYYHGLRDPDQALPKFRAVWQQGATLRRERPELSPMVISSRLYIGFCEFDRQRWDNAINAFRDVLREQPGNFDAYLRLALCYRHSNRPKECETMLHNMVKAIPPDSSKNRQFLAEVNLQLADLYLKDPVLRDRLFALTHLKEFVHQIGDVNHPALDPAREYIVLHDIRD